MPNKNQVKCLKCKNENFVKELETSKQEVATEENEKTHYFCNYCNYKFWVNKEVK